MVRKINRRHLFNLAFTSAISLGACGKLQQAANKQEPEQPSQRVSGRDAQVIVVGAGMAGLGAAQALQTKGYNVLVLEARDRIGGRVWTNRSLPDLALDLGASWIHGTQGNPLTDLARRFGITTLPTDYDSLTHYNFDGSELTGKQVRQLENQFETLMSQVNEIQSAVRDQKQLNISLQDAVEQVLSDLEPNRQQLRGLNYLINATIEHEYATDISNLSLYNFEQDEAFRGEDVLFPGGYGQISDRLAEGLTIKQGHIVQKVDYNSLEVKVITNQGTFTTDKVVITLPLGVLKAGSVEFSPALPPQKQTAIRKMGMGVLNKVYLRFPQVFWDNSREVLGYISQRPGEWSAIFNFHQYIQQPVLLCFNSGTYGAKLETWSDDKIIQAAMAVLQTIYGENIPEPQSSLITRWQADPFSRGSYSHLPPGTSNTERRALAEPIANRLFFAGEATSEDHPATVHGALLSGRQVAQQIQTV